MYARHQNRRASSLIELVFVLGLAALLLLSLPPTQSTTKTLRALRAIGVLHQQYSRIALVSGLSVRFSFVVGRGEFTICSLTESGTCNEATSKTVSLPKGVSIASARFAGSQSDGALTLYPSGTTTPGVVSISNQTSSPCALIVSLWGAQRTVC